MLLKKYSAQWERMRLADQSILFQEAWRCCLNNYFCRRVAMRSIGISDTLHTRLTTFEQNICRVRKKKSEHICCKILWLRMSLGDNRYTIFTKTTMTRAIYWMFWDLASTYECTFQSPLIQTVVTQTLHSSCLFRFVS